MTTHYLKISDHWHGLLWSGRKTCEVRIDDRDYQIGDAIRFQREGTEYWTREFRVIHVLKNFEGITPGWVVLSLEHPDAEWARQHRRELSDRVAALQRSNAALRGQITKLRRERGR